MIINVTQDHIDRGKMGRACRCPIALAVLEQLNLSVGLVCVTSHTLYIESKGHLMPPEASEFVTRFDAEKPVSPFTFEVTNDQNQSESGTHPISDEV